jgi:hypothetical protein
MNLLYFSGFCIKNEEELFDEYLIVNDFTVSGFSYGAIKALQYTLDCIEKGKRIDKLQLFSPAYFVDESTKFKRLQLMFFKKDEKEYKKNFLANTIYPNNNNMNKYIASGIYSELDELLNYKWKNEDLEMIETNNIIIEVYLGSEDKIVNSELSKDFFKQYGEVYFIKGVGHSLN